MERKIGEIFKYNGEWYQCIVGCHCPDCAFCNNNCEERERITLGNKLTKEETTGFCTPEFREDSKSVIFKKLEKVGKPYTTSNDKVMQNYLIEAEVSEYPKDVFILTNYEQRLIAIEIKQNKEDMVGKTNLYEKQTPLQKLMEIYCDGRMDYNEFEKKVKELYSDKGDDSKPILKPFDLEAAKQGKSVCTRDGRKARIICFDTKGDPCPIIALVEENGIEAAYHYDKNGQNAYNKSELDLMMLPEKKEGWANIVRGSDGKSHMGRGIFQSKEEAEDAIKAFNDNLIDTIKVSWEE